jgi:hypothetical protein
MDKRAQVLIGLDRRAGRPPIPAGTQPEEAVSVAEAASLLMITDQALYAQIRRGTLPGYARNGQTVLLVGDLASTRTAKRQTAREDAEAWRLSCLPGHLAEGGCVGRACRNWTHQSELPEPEPVRRQYSDARLAQLAQAREKAHLTNRAKNAERARRQAEDLARYRMADAESPISTGWNGA